MYCNLPKGYADVRAPNRLPTSKLKCLPNAGVKGPAIIVNPRRDRNEEIKIPPTDRFLGSFRHQPKYDDEGHVEFSESPVSILIEDGSQAAVRKISKPDRFRILFILIALIEEKRNRDGFFRMFVLEFVLGLKAQGRRLFRPT